MHLFLESGTINVQRPLDYCSINRADDISEKELTRLSELGLGALQYIDLNKTPTDNEIPETESVASSSTIHDPDIRT